MLIFYWRLPCTVSLTKFLQLRLRAANTGLWPKLARRIATRGETASLRPRCVRADSAIGWCSIGEINGHTPIARHCMMKSIARRVSSSAALGLTEVAEGAAFVVPVADLTGMARADFLTLDRAAKESGLR